MFIDFTSTKARKRHYSLKSSLNCIITVSSGWLSIPAKWVFIQCNRISVKQITNQVMPSDARTNLQQPISFSILTSVEGWVKLDLHFLQEIQELAKQCEISVQVLGKIRFHWLWFCVNGMLHQSCFVVVMILSNCLVFNRLCTESTA